MCVCERVRVTVWVYQCREKKISRSATPILENVLAHIPNSVDDDCCSPDDVASANGVVQGRSPTTRRTPMTNRSIGSIKTIIVGCVNEVYALVQL